MRLVLGIESSCDETAAAMVDSSLRVRSSVVASQAAMHAPYAGVVPEIASRAHTERIVAVVRGALNDANIPMNQIDAVAVANRPGLIGALLVGVAAAKSIALALGRPIVGVDHIAAHLTAGLLDPKTAPDATDRDRYPALGLVVSGGHTAIYALRDPLDRELLGTTIDDAVGEAFDKAATMLGLGYPGGPEIQRLATAGDPAAHDFPVSLLGSGSLDFSFSGLKTAVLYAVRGKPLPKSGGGRATFERDWHDLSNGQRADIAASFQESACRAIIAKLERAMERLCAGDDTPHRPRTLFVGGGVAANDRLRAMLGEFAARHSLALVLPPMAYCIDNAAMIAGHGQLMVDAGRADDPLTLGAAPTGSTALAGAGSRAPIDGGAA